jgi:polar amino acid transport system substrate-binding protein
MRLWVVLSAALAVIGTIRAAPPDETLQQQALDGAANPCILRTAVAEFPPYATRVDGASLDGTSLDGASLDRGSVESGRWTGEAVELFRATARDLGCEAQFIALSPTEILLGLERGDLDAVALPFTADPLSSSSLTLTPAFATSRIAIAVFREDFRGDLEILFRSLTTTRQLRVYGVMLILVILFAFIIWLLERSKNQHFRGKHREGLGSGLWWSITTLSTVGYGDKVPVSAIGRFFAGTWMLLSLVIVAIFTATVTSSITAHDASVEVGGAHDLSRARIGLVENGLASGYVDEHFLPHVSYPHLQLAIEDLRVGNLDAVLADEHSLERALRDLNEQRIVLLEKPVAKSPVAFGLRKTLPHEFHRQFDAALLKRLDAKRSQLSQPQHTPSPNSKSSP